MQTGFSPADILIPAQQNLSNWSVVACDQYTSEPEYWHRVAQRVRDTASAFHIILPEVWLDSPDLPDRITQVNHTMREYLADDFFTIYPHTYIYVERTLAPDKVRRGLIGKLDLEQYSYTAGEASLIRPTEGTVESRLPPRIQVRKDAPLETPHIMVLLDDLNRSVIEPLAAKTGRMQQVYDFILMEQGGAIRGWALDDDARVEIDTALEALLAQQAQYAAQLADGGLSPLLFAMGDGNHSLATAKACFEELKKTLPRSEWENHPARWALVELVNVHDTALEFEPIHRIVRGVEPSHLLKELGRAYELLAADNGGQTFTYLTAQECRQLWIANPSAALSVGSLQNFLDGYLSRFGGSIDYIHGEAVVEQLAREPDAVGFLLPCMQKSQLFPTVMLDGTLPRKTFSMGHAHEKRFYLECRRIR